MSKNTKSPYSNPMVRNNLHFDGSRRVGFKRGPGLFDLRNPGESPIQGAALFPCACALVEVILRENKDKMKPIFDEIVETLKNPEIWNYIDSNIPFNDPLPKWIIEFLVERKISPYPVRYVKNHAKKWRNFLNSNPNTFQTKKLIDEFIVRSLTPPEKNDQLRVNINNFSTIPSRRNKRVIYPENLPILFMGILFHALAFVQNVDFYKLDDLILGHDYELVTNTLKPSTEHDRKRKAELNELVRKTNAHFITYDTLLERAERFYRAYVLGPSCADVAAEYKILTSTLSHEIYYFRVITKIS